MKQFRAIVLLGCLLWCQVSGVDAHDFWLEPSAYWIAPDSLTALTLQVGHGPLRQRSPIPARRITRFQAAAPDGTTVDLLERLHVGEATEDGSLQFGAPGTYVVVLQTDDRAQTHLPAARFNDYLEAEGLTPALEQRARSHRTDADGSERYSRCAKAVIQVGAEAPGTQDQVRRPLGLPLEIVPELNPYADPPSTLLPVRVLYAGSPLPGALIKLTDLADDASPREAHRTDPDGRARFTLPNSGRWLLNVIWTKALGRSDEVDFETIFSSLSFGFVSSRPTPMSNTSSR